jgi:hypothetical protein
MEEEIETTAARMGCRAHMCIDISSSNFAARYAVFRCLLQRRGTVGLQRRGAAGLQKRDYFAKGFSWEEWFQ